MGRPVNKRNFGNPSDPGSQITVTITNGGTAHILRQRSNRIFEVSDDGSGSPGRVLLVNDTTPAVSEGAIIIRVGTAPGENASASSSLSIIASVLTNAGAGWNVNETITFSTGTASEGAVITVNSVVGEEPPGPIGTFTVTTSGIYSVIPNTDENGNTSGSGEGTGATFELGWGVGNVVVTTGGTGYDEFNRPSIAIGGNAAVSFLAGESGITVDVIQPGGVNVDTVGSGYTTPPNVTIIRPITDGTLEIVKTLHNNTARTFQGNSYKWSPGVGWSGLDDEGIIPGS